MNTRMSFSLVSRNEMGFLALQQQLDYSVIFVLLWRYNTVLVQKPQVSPDKDQNQYLRVRQVALMKWSETRTISEN